MAPLARSSSDERDELRSILIVQALTGVGPVRLEKMRDRFGSARAALRAPDRDFGVVLGREAAEGRADPALHDRAARALETCEELGLEVVLRGGPGYPERLEHLAQPPLVLFLRGDPSLLERPSVAVVGSRRSTNYGRRVAAEAARVLVRSEVVVASGLALGIDGVAHRAALEEGGSSLAVLGTGPDVVHPRSNRGLFEGLARVGLLVTEFAPGTPPLPHHFPRRNRILAALAEGVLVVEAARRSGALLTANEALEIGRNVMAVPGPVFASQSEGTNRLIRVGAEPLTSPEDVLNLLVSPVVRREPTSLGPALMGEEEGTTWEALGPQARGVDELAEAARLPVNRLLAVLATLEVEGFVTKEPGMRFRRAGLA